MVAVYTFTRALEETTEQLLRVFGSGGAAGELWSLQAELLVEPVGWDALWKLSKEFCRKFNVRYPCVACVVVTSVYFDGLCARIEVLSVQHESVSLPEMVEDVPLIELWPTINQREQCVDVTTTAECIDLMRFFYNNIWMPWDDQDNKAVLPNTIEERMQLWADLHNDIIPSCIAHWIILLRNSAINTHEQLKQLDSTLCEEDSGDDDVTKLPPNYIVRCAELTARLDCHMAKWNLYENALIREQYIAKHKSEWQKNKNKHNVAALWEGGSAFELDKVSQYFRSHLSTEHTITVTPSAKQALGLEPEELVVCSKQYEIPERPLSQISISSLNGATLRSTEVRSCLLMLTGDCALRDLTLRCDDVSAVVMARAGRLQVTRAALTGHSPHPSNFAQGIVAMPGATVLVEDTTFDSFYTGIVVHKGAHVELRNCSIQQCGVGIQMYSGARLALSGTAIARCAEHSVRCEVDSAATDTDSMEGLKISPDCTIGCGDPQKEVLIVRQDIY